MCSPHLANVLAIAFCESAPCFAFCFFSGHRTLQIKKPLLLPLYSSRKALAVRELLKSQARTQLR
jgi:hypothetical protein